LGPGDCRAASVALVQCERPEQQRARECGSSCLPQRWRRATR
jgi:hypothetical protein